MRAYRSSRSVRVLALVLAAAGACGGERAGSPPSAPTTGPSAAPPTVHPPTPRAYAGEIGPASEATSRGGVVVHIGRARLRTMPACCAKLVIRTRTNLVFAVDDFDVKEWDLADGVLTARATASTRKIPTIDLVVSADGSWVAAGDEHIDLVHDGRRTATAKWGIARGYTTTNQLIFEDGNGLAVVDPTTAAIAQRLPPQPFGVGAWTLDITGDDTQVWWLSKKGYARWDKRDGTFRAITIAGKKWSAGRIALRALVAMVEDDGMLYRLDLTTGALAKVTKRAMLFDLSPSGAWAALVDYKSLRVIDATTGAEIAKLATRDTIKRVAFSEVDGTLAFVEGGVIRVADIGNGAITVRVPDATSRFLGWVGDGIAAVDHEGTPQELDVATLTLGPRAGRVQAAPTSPLTLSLSDRTLVATLDQRQVARLEVGDPPRPARGLEQSYWKAVGSPTGNTFAVWVRRPDVPPEREPRLGDDGDRDPKCDLDPRKHQTCLLAYIMELWSVEGGSPTLRWRERPDSTRDELLRGWPYPKEASGPIAFTPDGKRVLFGFADGDVIVRATDASATSRTESLHRAPITRIEIAPGGKWVFTEDVEGEQRIWPL